MSLPIPARVQPAHFAMSSRDLALRIIWGQVAAIPVANRRNCEQSQKDAEADIGGRPMALCRAGAYLHPCRGATRSSKRTCPCTLRAVPPFRCPRSTPFAPAAVSRVYPQKMVVAWPGRALEGEPDRARGSGEFELDETSDLRARNSLRGWIGTCYCRAIAKLPKAYWKRSRITRSRMIWITSGAATTTSTTYTSPDNSCT